MAVFYKTRRVTNNELEGLPATAPLFYAGAPGKDKYETFNNFVRFPSGIVSRISLIAFDVRGQTEIKSNPSAYPLFRSFQSSPNSLGSVTVPLNTRFSEESTFLHRKTKSFELVPLSRFGVR